MNVKLKPSAEYSLNSITEYITKTIKMPETADKYIDKLLNFANQLSHAPNAYSLCKYPDWKIKNLQCATFNKTWVIAYKIVSNHVVIYYMKNGKLLNY